MSLFNRKTDTEKELEEYENSRTSTRTNTIQNENPIDSSQQSKYSNYTKSLTQNVRKKPNFPKVWLMLFLLVALGIMIYCGIMAFGFENGVINFRKLLSALFPAIFVIIGLALIFDTILKNKSKKEKCTARVVAVVTELLKKCNDNSTIYCPVYNFYYCGEHIDVCTNEYRNFDVPQVGQEVEILVNPDNPQEIFIPSKKAFAFIIVVGAAFVFMGIISMVALLGNN